MKKIILNFEKKTDNFKDLVQEALNMNLLNFLVSKETYSELAQVERIIPFTKNPEIPAKNLIFESFEHLKNKKKLDINRGLLVELTSKADEQKVIELSKTNEVNFIIVSAKDWKIIPFENLIAEMHTHDTDLIAQVDDVKEAELMLKTLEIGVDGILITPKDANEIVELKGLLQTEFNVKLTKAKITSIENISESERVCIDSTSLLQIGEGFLVGSTSKGFCLIHSETFETEFVASRPFRVNSGDVSAYVLVPDNDPNKNYRTKYLSELKGGDMVLAVTNKGEVRVVSIGRVKIETRPMLRFELEATVGDNKISFSCICQNAETVRFVDQNGIAKSVVEIKVGNEVLVHIGPGATHFGTAINEKILEK
ncbi:MAG: 3-dehydroquinate synthase II [Candidatus Lokiarchaeota archaeon]|nr:3-dehydroquinate synthase II [Candidatus Lokiarchaeota archaeon]